VKDNTKLNKNIGVSFL